MAPTQTVQIAECGRPTISERADVVDIATTRGVTATGEPAEPVAQPKMTLQPRRTPVRRGGGGQELTRRVVEDHTLEAGAFAPGDVFDEVPDHPARHVPEVLDLTRAADRTLTLTLEEFQELTERDRHIRDCQINGVTSFSG